MFLIEMIEVGRRCESRKLFSFIKLKETTHVWSDSWRVGCLSTAAYRNSVFVLQPRIGFLSIQIRELTSYICAIISVIKLTTIYRFINLRTQNTLKSQAINYTSTYFSGIKIYSLKVFKIITFSFHFCRS